MTRRTRHIAIWTGLVLVVGVTLGAALTMYLSAPAVTPEAVRYGLVENFEEEAAPIIAAHPPFQLVDAEGREVVQDNANANVRFWEVWAKNGLNVPPNYPQQVGDCTSFSGKNAIENRQGIEIGEGKAIRFRQVYPPFLYGVGRVQVGKGKVRGDGAVVAWVVQGMRDHGILFADDDGVPPYSGEKAREWGLKGPPQRFLDIASTRRVKTIAPVRTAAQARDAICNGYPVLIGSRFGSTDIRERDGRMVARKNTEWAHAMCVIGYDGTGATDYFCVLNSWGESAHPAPLQGEPRGSFWVTFSEADREIFQPGDCWSVTDLDGFVENQIDVNVFGANDRPARAVADARKTTLSF